ncbi:MAG TPA: cation transporter, partial [Pseudolabrys sp.]
MILQHNDEHRVDVGPVFLWAVVLNTSFVLVEASFGIWVGSLALLADAAHNLIDVAGLLVAWVAIIVG